MKKPELFRSSIKYASLSSWSITNIEERLGKLDQEEFDRFGLASDEIFRAIRRGMAPHDVWVRATSHPQAPVVSRRRMRVTFMPVEKANDFWSGSTDCGIWSRREDGTNIMEDLVEATASALEATHDALSLNSSPPYPPDFSTRMQDGLYFYQSVSLVWNMQT